ISVGRLPVKTAAEADAIVDKIIHYATAGASSGGQVCNNGAASSFGDWRNVLAFIADDEDSNIHLLQTETLDTYVDTNYRDYNILPAFMTATCDFSTADDPSITSAGELVLLNPRGGGISLFTTTRLAYSQANFDLGKKFYTHVFNPIGSRMPRMGEICMLTKN